MVTANDVMDGDRERGEHSRAPLSFSLYDELDRAAIQPSAGQAPVTTRPLVRRRTVAVATTVATGLAVVGWTITSAAAGGTTVKGFPRIASLTSSPASPDAVASRVERSVVDITAKQGYIGSSDAGTGMIITAAGHVLTNNHVVRGATSITVRLVSTGATYTAKVVGTDASDDVAVLRIVGAPRLTPITAGDADRISTGTPVIAIGNALAKPGLPTVTTGHITGTKRTITAADQGAPGEKLTGLLQTDAAIISGDSGGPLADSAGQVVGMNTAAGAGAISGIGQSVPMQSGGAGYAIPITKALSIAGQIVEGRASSSIVIGTPGFLGIRSGPHVLSRTGGFLGGPGWGTSNVPQEPTDDTGNGDPVVAVLPGGPAYNAGLRAGDSITGFDGRSVHSPGDLFVIESDTRGGQRITLTWTDPSGTTHEGSTTLISGPAA